MNIVWDEIKRRANLDKHGMDFADLDVTFFESAVIVPSRSGRLVAIGRLNGPTAVVFAPLGTEAISIVSMRAASVTERRVIP